MERYDIAVIGTGPAGLEAAITAKVRNKSVLLLGGKGSSDKVSKAHTIQNYLGLPNVSGEDMAKAFLDHAKSMGVEITEDKVNAVYSMGQYFAIQCHGGDYEATSVIVAAGMTAMKPFAGEMENLGRGVSYCATCDAALYKGKTAIILAYSSEDEAEASFLAERAETVYYLPQYDYNGKLENNIKVSKDVKPQAIEMIDGQAVLHTDSEDFKADGIFILREQIAPSQLVPGLQMDGNHVMVDRSMATNIKGLFACGDITGTPYQYIKAAGEGNVAALSAVSYLNQVK
ncbi:NAD(P)/FAD-dependent oxidoreductase [Pseudobutyrivibrio xylanivorans]|uniref:NAD(P)/FAD-dependent oxidoreductase n=1 Tax=Pseudobutyrivibrio xylanivorans TaxID=185007 RepID=A0A5P6VRE7_PSEXY|nr:NAD(P)/FAD-dependent oxidoreductase [Pseudobutyrivibrio xylanivorans]QFJ55196.1 NAD(P)/FAD-dependent oxidoreductase [Pseudobutyrivibrio xylanivorans]